MPGAPSVPPPAPSGASDSGQEVRWCVEWNGEPHAEHDFIPARGVAPAHKATVVTLVQAGARSGCLGKVSCSCAWRLALWTLPLALKFFSNTHVAVSTSGKAPTAVLQQLLNTVPQSPAFDFKTFPSAKQIANVRRHQSRQQGGQWAFDSVADIAEWGQANKFPATRKDLLVIPEDQVLLLPGASQMSFVAVPRAHCVGVWLQSVLCWERRLTVAIRGGGDALGVYHEPQPLPAALAVATCHLWPSRVHSVLGFGCNRCCVGSGG